MKLTAKTLIFASIFLCTAPVFVQASDDYKIGCNGSSDLTVATMNMKFTEKVLIYDLSGKLIKETLTDDEYALDTLPFGSYIINILDDAGNTITSNFYIK